jgi:transformation/transcription domain-associated protein
MHFRHVFAKQWGVNCLMQYAFSVLERIPNRVVFLTSTGQCQSPDFRVMYNGHGGIDTQLVPFRMSPSLSRLIGFPLLEGFFVTTMSTVAKAVWSNKEHLIPILLLLMRDDCIAYFTKSMAKSDTKTQEMERQLTDRMSSNVSYILSRIQECVPNRSPPPLNLQAPVALIDEGVRKLLEKAQSPERLSRMPGTYQAWL